MAIDIGGVELHPMPGYAQSGLFLHFFNHSFYGLPKLRANCCSLLVQSIEGVEVMGLLPQEVLDQLSPLHTQDARPDHELFAYARLTYADLVWFVMELDSKDRDTFSGYLLDEKTERFGYFSLAYLEE